MNFIWDSMRSERGTEEDDICHVLFTWILYKYDKYRTLVGHCLHDFLTSRFAVDVKQQTSFVVLGMDQHKPCFRILRPMSNWLNKTTAEGKSKLRFHDLFYSQGVSQLALLFDRATVVWPGYRARGRGFKNAGWTNNQVLPLLWYICKRFDFLGFSDKEDKP